MHTMKFIYYIFLITFLLTSQTYAATVDTVNYDILSVCADPANLPFSNKEQEGFDNKIAELMAKKMQVPLYYTWYPNNIKSTRQTLQARQCDLILGTALGANTTLNTNPYYHSTYALVYRKDAKFEIKTLSDPKLKALKIGVVAASPASKALQHHDLLHNMASYIIPRTKSQSKPTAQRMIKDLATNKIDVAIIWGPWAGYYAKKSKTPMKVVPLFTEQEGVRLNYWVAMGVRQNELEWKHHINDVLAQLKPQIDDILKSYNVPLLDERQELLNPEQF